ncbi:ecdysone oxidase-like [Cydia pomonella]|uniref:ecdysone oxidase-like n=1 Tax=Cydia pomonella TaxID=82600 RepID=UPI002ADE852C|nr:ecdysone oxidase-like [Cydia pomonella]XP_061716584.1 ecdysone oxidase-like [Cydia pomonella]
MPQQLAWLVLFMLFGGSRLEEVTDGSKRSYCTVDSHKNTYLQDNSTFDYIVVGAGGGGVPAAARLALAGADVLLIDAGGDPSLFTKIPGMAVMLLGSEKDWAYPTISNNVSCLSSQQQQCRFSRGKCLGGSTSINYMMYTRGNRRDYDDLGIKGWSWQDLKPYFLKYEGLQDLDKLPATSIPYHNTNGTMKIEFFGDSENSWHSRIVQGFQALNVSFNPDVNAESEIGVTQVIGYVYEGERMSTARGYLARNDVKRVLKVAKDTQCTGVIFDDMNNAIGIKVITKKGSTNRILRLYAKKEVILSAGTIGTAQILMLSGIGPAAHLNSLGIPVRADLPVGDNISDHVLPLIYIPVPQGHDAPRINPFSAYSNSLDLLKWCKSRTGTLASNGVTDITAMLNSHCYDFAQRKLIYNSSDCELPSLQMVHSFIEYNQIPGKENLVQRTTGLNMDIIQQLSATNKNQAIIVATPVVLRPYSRGTIRLASTDPLKHPAIFPNYLSDKRDVEEMLRSITILEHLVETPEYAARNASILHLRLPGCLEYSEDREGYWTCYIRHLTYSVFHAVGSAPLGAVLDEELRVRGVARLRVADLSVLPELPRGNTAAVAIAIGERVADFILKGVKEQ